MPEQIEIDLSELEDLVAGGKTLKACAEEMGIKEGTLYARASGDHEVRAAVERGRFRARRDGVEAQPEKPAGAPHKAAKKRRATKAVRATKKRRAEPAKAAPPPRNLRAEVGRVNRARG
jgi:hypothetical protein